MSTHHSIVVARSMTPLPLLPQVRSAFGTSCFNLIRYDDGWQMAEITVFPHQWATVGAGPAPIAAVTGAPVLAAWISDTACAQIAAAIPEGPSWTAHLFDEAEDDCFFDHEVFNTLRAAGPKQPPADPAHLATDLAAWSAAAGRTTTTARIEAQLRDRNSLLEYRYRATIDALGLGTGVTVERQYWTNERIRTAWHLGWQASCRIPTPWNKQPRASPRTTALVAFLEHHDAARFDPSIIEADLATHAQQALVVGQRQRRKAPAPRTNTHPADPH
ncbi:hypothetical protein AB0K00_18110 [Dactylosporangium sp. NPDC049525]|uniref:hypothetical protein n=1 Tax=Dactylosporangium sp. NPDC049525 TaxID=3154730 RepID=UPI00344362FD